METKIGVVAFNKKQFDDWVSHSVEFQDRDCFLCLTNLRDVRAVKFSHVIRIGTWYKNRDADEIYYRAKQRIE